MFFENNQDISSEKKKKKRAMMKKKKPTLSLSASEGQLGKVIVDEIEEQPDEGIVKEIGDSFQQLKVIDEIEVLAAEETPRKKTGSLESKIVVETEGQAAGETPRKKKGNHDSEIVDKTEGQAPEETPQKTEKIPDTCYWDRKWKEGWSQYRIQELEDNIDKTEKDFKENDLSTLREQLMNSSNESPAKWKKKSRKDLNKKEIIRKHVNWELKRRTLQCQCQFLGLEYQEPKPFPEYCESDTGKKMTFFMDYYWPPVNRHVFSWSDFSESEYIKVWKEWVYDDEDRIEDLEKKIKKEINKRVQLIIASKWKLIPPSEQELIRQKESEILQKADQEIRHLKWVKQQRISARIVDSDPSGYVSGPTGSVAYGPNERCKTHGEAMQELKQFMRDS